MKKVFAILFMMVFVAAHAQNSNMNFKMIHNAYIKDVNDQIEFSSILSESNQYYLIEGTIAFDDEGNCLQSITKNKKVKQSEIADLEAKQKTNNSLSQENYTAVFFIQFQKGDDNSDLMEKSKAVNAKIEEALMISGLGQSYGVSKGENVANVEFEVTQQDKALQVIMDVLKAGNMLNHCLIGKRVYLEEEDYNYHIFYPIAFSGTVNPY